MCFIEGRFWSEVAVNFVSLFYWPTTCRAFVRGRPPLQRPIVDPRTSDLYQYSLLGACMYRTRYQVCCTWNERLETGVRTKSTRIVYYCSCCCTYIVVAHIPISLLNFEGVACRILFTLSANTPKPWWEGNLLFLAEGNNFFRKVFPQHSNICPQRPGTRISWAQGVFRIWKVPLKASFWGGEDASFFSKLLFMSINRSNIFAFRLVGTHFWSQILWCETTGSRICEVHNLSDLNNNWSCRRYRHKTEPGMTSSFVSIRRSHFRISN